MIRYGVLTVLVLTCSTAVTAQIESDTGPSIWAAAGVGLASTAVPVGIGLTLTIVDGAPLHAEGLAIMVLGTVVGPSMGSLVLGDSRRAGKGVLMRTGASAALLASAVIRLGAGWEGGSSGWIHLSNAAMVGSLVWLAYGVTYNFTTLGSSSRELGMQAGLGYDAHSGTVMPGIRVQF